MKLLPKNLYSRLTLITVATVITGYAIMYAWTNLDPTQADSGKPLTSTLMKSVINSINDIGTRTDGITSVGGNIGIGTANPNNKIDIKGNLEVGAGTRGAIIKSTVSDNFNITTFNNTPNPNFSIGYGNGAGGTDLTKEYITANAGHISFMNSNVGIGTATPQGKLEIVQSLNTSRTIIGAGLNGGIWGTNTAGNLHIDADSTLTDGRIYLNWYNGKGVAVGNGGASYGSIYAASFTTASDQRLKENITTITDPLKKIKALRGVNFQWKSDHHKDIGFIAQEIEKILPDIVTADTQGYKAVRYPNITAVLVEAVKEQQKQIEELKIEIKELKDK